MRPQFLSLLLLATACEAGTIPLIPDAEPDTNWLWLLEGTTQRGPVQEHLIVFAHNGHDPLPGVQVLLHYGDGNQVAALTNDSGRADFYEPDLYGPVDLHFLHDDYDRRSWLGVDAGIVTVRMNRGAASGGSAIPERPDSSSLRVTVRGMDQLPASNADQVRFAFVAKDRLSGVVPRALGVFEQVPGPQVTSNVTYYPGYRLDLVAVGGLTRRAGLADEYISWKDITRIGIGNNPDPAEPQIIELTHALDQEVEFEFQESAQLIREGLMEEWHAHVQITEPNLDILSIPAVYGAGGARTAKVPRLNGSFSNSKYGPVLKGTASGGAFESEIMVAGPNKWAVSRLVLPRTHARLQGRTLELSAPSRPVDVTFVSLGSERRWVLLMFEQRDQVVLPVDPGPLLHAPYVFDLGLAGLDVGHFNGDSQTQRQCSARSHFPE